MSDTILNTIYVTNIDKVVEKLKRKQLVCHGQRGIMNTFRTESKLAYRTKELPYSERQFLWCLQGTSKIERDVVHLLPRYTSLQEGNY